MRECLHVHFIRLRSKTVFCKVVAYRRWSLTRSGSYESVDCIRNSHWRTKITHTCDMSMKLHGVAVSTALNCFQASFCNWLIFPVFRFGVPKPTVMVCLITLVVISFRFCINISKLNMFLWAAVLWLSCCNCCVDRLLLLWLSALKKFAAFAKSLYSLQSTTLEMISFCRFCAYYVFSNQNCFHAFCSRAIKNSDSLLQLDQI